MTLDPRNPLSELERELKAKFNKDDMTRFTSNSKDMAGSDYMDELLLPEESRGNMPYTKSDYVVSENPMRIAWEREVRKFLRKLTSRTSHRISAVMIYEWATGIKVKELEEEDKKIKESMGGELPKGYRTNLGNLNVHLRHINFILKAYFGQPYKTKIMGREVGRAYTVRQDYRVRDKKPVCVSLLPEFREKVLDV